jgi:hypothetical protein
VFRKFKDTIFEILKPTQETHSFPVGKFTPSEKLYINTEWDPKVPPEVGWIQYLRLWLVEVLPHLSSHTCSQSIQTMHLSFLPPSLSSLIPPSLLFSLPFLFFVLGIEFRDSPLLGRL